MPSSAGLVLGGVAGLVALILVWVAAEQRPRGLVVPPGRSLPAPRWQLPLAVVGLATVLCGVATGPLVAYAGMGLLAVAAGGEGFARTPSPRAAARDRPDRQAVVAARAVRAFARRHAARSVPDHRPAGTPEDWGADAVLEHVNRGAVRVVVVAADGAFGDVVVAGAERARLAAELAGVPVSDQFPPGVARRMATTAYEWRRMAGQQLTGDRRRS